MCDAVDSETQLRLEFHQLQVKVRQLEKENAYYRQLHSKNKVVSVSPKGIDDPIKIHPMILERKKELHAIIDNIPPLVWLKDIEDRFLAINKSFAQFYGYTIQEIIGRTDFDICSQALAEKYRNSELDVIKHKEQKAFKGMIQGKTECFRAEILEAPALNDLGEIIGRTGIANDIDARKQGEKVLKERDAAMWPVGTAFSAYIYKVSQDYRIDFANEALISRIGYNPVGKHCYEVFHSCTSICPWCINERVFQGETVCCEIPTREDRRWYYSVNVPIDNDDGTMSCYALIFDITGIKQAQEKIKHSRDFYFSVLDKIPNPIWTATKDGRCDYVNLAYFRFTGLSRQQILDFEWMNLIYPDDAIRFMTTYRQAFAKQQQYMIEYRIAHRDGTYHWIVDTGIPYVDVDGNYTGFIGFSYDINDRKLEEEAHRNSEQRYCCLVKQSSDGIVVIDPVTKKVIEANERFLTMLGWKEQEIVGISIYDLKLMDKNKIHQEYQQILGKGHLHIEVLKTCTRDGENLDLELEATMIYCKDKPVIMFNIRNITEQNQLQQILKQNVILAGEVQRGLLPRSIKHHKVKIEVIFEPYHLVSGDSYGYMWNADCSRLFGFVLDVTGHGLATALQTSAINVLFHQVAGKKISLAEKLAWVNKEAIRYFTDESFAAVICFELDFNHNTLTYASGGINYFLACSRRLIGIVKTPGSLIGISKKSTFEEKTIPLQQGDTFYFMSDGIFDLMRENEEITMTIFDKSVRQLEGIARDEKRWDDASAVCLQISGLDAYPQIFEISSLEEYIQLRPRISQILAELPLPEGSMMELAVNEAVNNALIHSSVDGQEPNITIEITVSKDNKLVILVKDQGPGFPGNQYLALLTSMGEDYFEQILMQDSGRGIMLMQAAADYISYNQRGNEVTLVKLLS